MSIRESSIF